MEGLLTISGWRRAALCSKILIFDMSRCEALIVLSYYVVGIWGGGGRKKEKTFSNKGKAPRFGMTTNSV